MDVVTNLVKEATIIRFAIRGSDLVVARFAVNTKSETIHFFIHNKLTGREYNRHQIFLCGAGWCRESNSHGRDAFETLHIRKRL